MKKFFVIALVAAAFAIALPAQGYGKGKGNWGKNAGKNAGKGGNNGPGGYMKKAIENLGWGEDGTEERVLPGDTVKDDDKEKRLEQEADKLGLEDKKVRKDFIKYAKLGWQKAEREDSRWARDYKRYKDNEDALKKARDKHKEKLDKAWADADEYQTKKEILTEDQLKTFQKNTEDLRKETATDKSIRQDEIRAKKIEELKKNAADYMKNAGGGTNTDGSDNKVKKEKKDDNADSKDGEDGADKEKKDDGDK